jgi:hypothetical protein
MHVKAHSRTVAFKCLSIKSVSAVKTVWGTNSWTSNFPGAYDALLSSYPPRPQQLEGLKLTSRICLKLRNTKDLTERAIPYVAIARALRERSTDDIQMVCETAIEVS